MKIQLLLVLAAVAVFCESPPRLIKPVPNPVIAAQTKKPAVPKLIKSPGDVDPSKDDFKEVLEAATYAVETHLRRENKAPAQYLLPVKLLALREKPQNTKDVNYVLDVELAETTCKYGSLRPGEYTTKNCPFTGKGEHQFYRVNLSLVWERNRSGALNGFYFYTYGDVTKITPPKGKITPQ